MTEEFYLGPDFKSKDKQVQVFGGVSTVADQLRSFGIPEDQLQPEVPVHIKSLEPKPPAGLPKSFWKDLGVGQD